MTYEQLPLFSDDGEPRKRCSQCKQFKPLSEFGTHRSMSDGLRSACKECCRISDNEYRQRHPDKVKAKKQRYLDSGGREKARTYSREYQRAHKEERQSYMERWRAENRDRYLEYARRYGQQHKDEIKQKRRAKYAENPHPFNEMRQRRRARIKHAPGAHTAQDLERQHERQHGCCYWCSKPLESDATIDHVIPLVRGGSNNPDNLVIACRSCNSRKRTRIPYTEWQPPNPLKPD